MVAIARHLRRAWAVIPTEPPTYNGVSRFLQRDNWSSEEDRRRVPRNPNKDDIESAWRKAVAFYWNHIFFDVMNFLSHAQPDVGHFHVPNAKKIALDYPKSNAVYRKKWNSNIIILPAFLDAGVSIRVETRPSARSNEPWGLLGVFDGTNVNEIWYIRKNFEVDIHVDVESKTKRHGVAAVLIYAVLCTELHKVSSKELASKSAEWKDKGKGLGLSGAR